MTDCPLQFCLCHQFSHCGIVLFYLKRRESRYAWELPGDPGGPWRRRTCRDFAVGWTYLCSLCASSRPLAIGVACWRVLIPGLRPDVFEQPDRVPRSGVPGPSFTDAFSSGRRSLRWGLVAGTPVARRVHTSSEEQ